MGVVRGLGVMTAIAVIGAASAGAQVTTGTITGRIVDSTTSEPLPGVTVRVVGSQVGTQSRPDGNYTLVGIPMGLQIVQVNRIGYAAQRQPVTISAGGTQTVNFLMRAVAATLSDVVVVGYGTQRREAVTAAIATVNADEAKVGVQPNVNQMIQGRAAGVQITQNSGDPGSGAQIRIRGGSSISASNEPLYVIDGVPIANDQNQVSAIGDPSLAQLPRSPLNTLNPADIAEISILKDASATAIYGSRGANGVVLITTRKGAAGTSSMDYDGYVGFASSAKQLDVLSAGEYRGFIQSQVNLYLADSVAGKAVADRRGLPATRLAALGSANTNWQDEISRTARIQSHNLAFSGGSQATTYRASLNYFDQPGITLGSGLTRYQGRLNGATRALDDRLTLNLNMTASQVRDQYVLAENRGGFAGGVFINALQFNPTFPVMASNPAVGTTPFYEIGAGSQNDRNPLGLTQQLNDHSTTNRILSNLLASYTLLPNLTASVNVGVDRSTGERATYYPAISPYSAGFNGQARQASRNLQQATIQTLLNYDQPFETSFLGKQSVNAVVGYEYQRGSIDQFGVERRDFVTDATGANNISVGANGTVPPFSNLEIKKQLGIFGRLNYGLKERYFVTATARKDGASMFGANHKYAFFPGISASWRLSEEDFMHGMPFNDLKLRAGFGKQGNQAISPYRSLYLLSADANSRYPFGSTLITGVLPSQNPNPNLKWETTSQSDAAIDFAVLKSRLSGTIEYYSKNTEDLLLEIPVPQPAVVATRLDNIGRVKNAGWEGSLDALLLNEHNRTLSVGLTYTANRNRVVSLGELQQIFTGIGSGQGQSATNSEIIVPGEPLGTFVGPVYAGASSDGRQLFNDYDPATGKVVGKVTYDQLGAEDRNRRLGNANPKAEWGLRSQATLGGFTGSFLIRAVTGNKVFNNTAAVYSTKANAANNKNFLKSALNDGLAITESNFFSSRFVEDGSFLRLQNVTLGYSIPLRLLRVPRATGAQIYVSGDNLFLATHYSGVDPEVFTDAGIASRGIDYLSYPRARTFTTGLRLGF